MANNIKAARLTAGLTQRQAAESLHVSQSGYQAWESGRSKIDSASILGMSRLFGVSMDYIMGVTDNPSPNRDGEKPAPAIQRDDEHWLDISDLTQENKMKVRGFALGLLSSQNTSNNDK